MNAIKKELPRDVLITEIHKWAAEDKNVVFLCCDLGAKALDDFRVKFPDQFIHTGISEQNMVDVAAGLALDGKKVFVYAMAPFVTFRCYEQIKVALAAMNLPVTVVGVGVGYGYDDAGPTHYATEDLGVMRSLANIEILTPGDTTSVIHCVDVIRRQPKLRYLRLDRQWLPDVYPATKMKSLDQGLLEVVPGRDLAIITQGYMLQVAMQVRERLQEQAGLQIGVIDAYRIKPLESSVVKSVTEKYQKLVTLEEHFLSAGLGSSVLEALCDFRILGKEVLRLGVSDQYLFENGGRKYIHQMVGLGPDSVATKVLNFYGEKNQSQSGDLSFART